MPGYFSALHPNRSYPAIHRRVNGGLYAYQQQKMKMILNDKDDCVESSAGSLERTAAWRRTLVVKFPDDPRNLRAADTLETLAVAAADLTDEQWHELQPHFGGWASETWRNALSQSARVIGFQHRSVNFNYFFKILLQNLTPESVAA
jgi:hypothetical protein